MDEERKLGPKFDKLGDFKPDQIKNLINAAAARGAKGDDDFSAVAADIVRQIAANRTERERVLSQPLEERVIQAAEIALIGFYDSMNLSLSDGRGYKDFTEIQIYAREIAVSESEKALRQYPKEFSPEQQKKAGEDLRSAIKFRILAWFSLRRDQLIGQGHVPSGGRTIQDAWQIFLDQFDFAFRSYAFPKNPPEADKK